MGDILSSARALPAAEQLRLLAVLAYEFSYSYGHDLIEHGLSRICADEGIDESEVWPVSRKEAA